MNRCDHLECCPWCHKHVKGIEGKLDNAADALLQLNKKAATEGHISVDLVVGVTGFVLEEIYGVENGKNTRR